MGNIHVKESQLLLDQVIRNLLVITGFTPEQLTGSSRAQQDDHQFLPAVPAETGGFPDHPDGQPDTPATSHSRLPAGTQ